MVESSTYDASADDVMWNTVAPAEWSAAEIHLSIMACEFRLSYSEVSQLTVSRLFADYATRDACVWWMGCLSTRIKAKPNIPEPGRQPPLRTSVHQC